MQDHYRLENRAGVISLKKIRKENEIRKFCNDVMTLVCAILTGCVFAVVMIWAAR